MADPLTPYPLPPTPYPLSHHSQSHNALTNTSCRYFFRDHQIRESREEKAAELEERVEEVMRERQRDLQETRTKHKKELAKVSNTGQMAL